MEMSIGESGLTSLPTQGLGKRKTRDARQKNHFSMKIYPMYYVVFTKWIKGEICCGRLKVIFFQFLQVYEISLQAAPWFSACVVFVSKTFPVTYLNMI